MPPGVRHSFRWDSDQASRHGYVYFGYADVRAAVAPEVRLTRMSSADPLAGLCAYLLWLGRSNMSDWQTSARGTLEFMLSLLENGPLPSDEVHSEVRGPVAAAVSYLQHQWSYLPLRRVGVTEIAMSAHVSRGYLNRLFRDTFGSTVSVALEHLLCPRAEALLTRTDLPIASIAHQCGYADLSHFSHRFSGTHGMSPSAYRGLGSRSRSVLEQAGVLQLSRLIWE